MEGRRSVPARRVTERGRAAERASLAEEAAVEVRRNGTPVARLQATPVALGDLGVGHLALAGWVRRAEDVHEVEVRGPGRGAWRVDVQARPRARARPPRPALPPRSPRLARAQVHALMQALREGSRLYLGGGGVHTSALATPDGIVLLAEDVGKVNTLDRLAGQALLRGLDTRGHVLLCTGRLTGEMASKALALGCPWLVSHSAPTTAGLEAARAAGASVAGYVRGSAFVLYADGQRLRP